MVLVESYMLLKFPSNNDSNYFLVLVLNVDHALSGIHADCIVNFTVTTFVRANPFLKKRIASFF